MSPSKTFTGQSRSESVMQNHLPGKACQWWPEGIDDALPGHADSKHNAYRERSVRMKHQRTNTCHKHSELQAGTRSKRQDRLRDVCRV